MNQYLAAVELLEALPGAIRAKRDAGAIGLREAARQIGIAASHLSALEAGSKNPGLTVVMKVLAWLGKK